MEFFLDTGEVDEIREAAQWGIIDGVTTNPSLIANLDANKPMSLKKLQKLLMVPFQLKSFQLT